MQRKMTKTAIAKLKAPHPSGKQKLIWDTELKGFGVLLSGKTNARTFVVQRDVGGNTRRFTIGPVNVLDLEDARNQARAVLVGMYMGIDPKAKKKESHAAKTTVGEILVSYLATRKALRPKTAFEYRASVERYLSDWADRPINEISREMVVAKHKAIADQIRRSAKSHNVTGHTSANTTMRVFRLLWNHANEIVPDLPDNPVTRLSRMRAWYPEKRREVVIAAADLPQFYQAVLQLPSPIHRDYILLVLFTGFRKSEAASLRWEDIDLSERIIRLSASRTKAGRKLDLPMSDFLYDLLVARRALGRDGPFLFPANSRSGHMEEPRFALDTIAERTGIKITTHDLRRTFITVAESTNIPIYALKGLVNHSLGTDVTAGYVIAGAERLREPMQKVTDRLKELCEIEEINDPDVLHLSV